MSRQESSSDKWIYPAIFLLSAATLTYEIGLTRVFSISQGYHFSFLVISIALLGIGAGGAVVTVGSRQPAVGSQMPGRVSTLSALFSIVSVLSFLAANQIMFDPVKAAWSKAEFLKILAQYLVLSLPFVISGMILSLVYKYMTDRTHRLYLADMAGAGAGCLLVLYLFSISGGEGAVIVSALLSLLASFLFLSASPLRGKTLLLPVMTKGVVLLAVLWSGQLLEIKMSPYRELSSILSFPGARTVETIHTPSGKVDIVESPAVRAAPGISITHQSPLPPQLGFTINGGGLATVTSPKGDLSFLSHLPSALPYLLREKGDVFVVDAGGGMEILSAIFTGAATVSGSETKGAVVEAMTGPLLDFSGGIYEKTGIRHGYGRTVLKYDPKKYDIIQLPLTDTLGSASSGFMGLHEEYNLTVEAFSEYLGHLKEDGFIAASIYLIPPPRQELKLLATMTEAIEKENTIIGHRDHRGHRAKDLSSKTTSVLSVDSVANKGFSKNLIQAKNRIIAIRSWGVLTILAKNGEITREEIEKTRDFCAREKFDLVWHPGMKEEDANLYNRLSEPIYFRHFETILTPPSPPLAKGGTGGVVPDRGRFFRDYLFDVRPATDERPFFGQTFKMTRMKDTYENVGGKWGILIEGGYLLPWVLAQSLLASIILIMAPLLLTSSPSGGGLRWGKINLLPITIYFASIGIGFMFLEISLMQQMIPVLGEPAYAISAVLFTILLSTGTGSYISGRFRIIERYSINVILIVPAFAVVYLLLLNPAAEAIVHAGIASRFILTSLLLFPLGMVMGMPFPTGMSILGKEMPHLIPWAWCVNGTFSVISSVLTMMIAMSWGFGTVHIVAAACYLLAWAAVVKILNPPSNHRDHRGTY